MDITFGQKLALQILSAEELGLKPNYTNEAKIILRKGEILPSLILQISNEAKNCVNEILNKNLKKEATEITKKILNSI